jgi:TolB-like protein/cytochrome c-type biogenesis protein CcmH/NrfG
MGAESAEPASIPTGAVFLSYASQDAEAARKICEALRAAGIEVWFDQSELRGGDVWDQTIRRQIKACALFIPVISRHTHERREGYFRLEWKLAVDRSNLISATQAFLLPVVIDDTREDDEEVPEKIRDIHWTRLPAGETPPAFVERVQRLLSPEASTTIRGPASGRSDAVGTVRAPVRASWSSKHGVSAAVAVVALAALGYFAIDKPWISKPGVKSPTVAASAAPAVFSPPPRSIAVLPFVNMSGDKEQEFFSEGLTEELLNSLSRINELQVAARTSSFSFQGEHPDIATVAHRLNVAAVLEGSVRRSAHTVRITTQLVNGVSGFHIWSQTYDRDLGDVLQLQSEIATAVASALKVTLLGNEAQKIEIGGTRNPAAFEAYLRASKVYHSHRSKEDLQAAIAGYTEAIRLDPDYALAYAERSFVLSYFADAWVPASAAHEYLNKAREDARRAIALAPELGSGHLVLARVLEDSLEFVHAGQEYERALALAPGNARVQRKYGAFAVFMGRTEAGLAAAKRSVLLDPLNFDSHMSLGQSLLTARRYGEAIQTFTDAKTLTPDNAFINGWLGLAYYGSGDFQSARTVCEGPGNEVLNGYCLALVFNKLGRHTDAETALAKAQALWSGHSVIDAGMYAQLGDTARALDLLEKGMREHDPSLENVKMDPWFDPLRNEPRFQAVMRELKFPD